MPLEKWKETSSIFDKMEEFFLLGNTKRLRCCACLWQDTYFNVPLDILPAPVTYWFYFFNGDHESLICSCKQMCRLIHLSYWATCSADSLITTKPEDVLVACMRTWRSRCTTGYPEVLFVLYLQRLCCELYITIHIVIFIIIHYMLSSISHFFFFLLEASQQENVL